MKIIIILLILVQCQGQFVDEQSTNVDTSTRKNSFSLITNEIDLSTYENEITISNSIVDKREEWININQTSIFWQKINDNSSTYVLKSDGKCVVKMCSIKLKSNQLFEKRKEGCLSFILSTIGQPIGRLWIEQDQEEESFSQKLELSNSSLHVQHSLKSNLKYLSIDAQILFRNIKFDQIILSNLNINWNGSCPIKSNSNRNPIPEESTITSYFSESYSETTNENLFNLSTIKSPSKSEFSSSNLNESNLLWILLLIVLFCLLIILLSILYGLWSINKHYRSIWFFRFNSPIQFLFRRSIRSSTKSTNPMKTLQQISNEIFEENNFDCLTISSQNNSF